MKKCPECNGTGKIKRERISPFQQSYLVCEKCLGTGIVIHS